MQDKRIFVVFPSIITFNLLNNVSFEFCKRTEDGFELWNAGENLTQFKQFLASKKDVSCVGIIFIAPFEDACKPGAIENLKKALGDFKLDSVPVVLALHCETSRLEDVPEVTVAHEAFAREFPNGKMIIESDGGVTALKEAYLLLETTPVLS